MNLSREGHGLHGFINKQGTVIIEPKYIFTDRFRNGKAWVIYPADTHYGLSYIDRTGKEVYKLPIQHYPNDYLIKESTIDFTPFVEQQIQRSKLISPFKYGENSALSTETWS